MRIVGLKEFRSLPVGTVFLIFVPGGAEELRVLEKIWEVDFISTNIIYNLVGEDDDTLNRMEADSSLSISVDFYSAERDGCFDDDQLFAVYDKRDIEGLINRLTKSLEAYK